MPVERGSSSWVRRAGYARARTIQHWLFVVGAAPFVWFLVERDFRSSNFHWAVFALVLVPTLATAWAATHLRCSVCGMPVYAFFLLGLPRSRGRGAFDALPQCPYCLDDGTGRLGDARRVDRRKEGRVAIRSILLAIALFIGLIAAAFLLAVFGWLPGYEGLV